MKVRYDKAVALLEAMGIKAEGKGWSTKKVQERLETAILKYPDEELGSEDDSMEKLFEKCCLELLNEEDPGTVEVTGGPKMKTAAKVEKTATRTAKKKRPVKKTRRKAAEEDEEEEEETPRRRKGKKRPAKKKTSKRSEGPSAKEQIFKRWLKSPKSSNVPKWAEQFDSVQIGTIRSWVSGWKAGKGLPSIASEMKAEVKAAMKRAKQLARAKDE